MGPGAGVIERVPQSELAVHSPGCARKYAYKADAFGSVARSGMDMYRACGLNIKGQRA